MTRPLRRPQQGPEARMSGKYKMEAEGLKPTLLTLSPLVWAPPMVKMGINRKQNRLFIFMKDGFSQLQKRWNFLQVPALLTSGISCQLPSPTQPQFPPWEQNSERPWSKLCFHSKFNTPATHFPPMHKVRTRLGTCQVLLSKVFHVPVLPAH